MYIYIYIYIIFIIYIYVVLPWLFHPIPPARLHIAPHLHVLHARLEALRQALHRGLQLRQALLSRLDTPGGS